MPGFLVILSAPSGGGKTTVVERLLKRHTDWIRSISMTTRPRREKEVEGQDYFFVSEKDFRKMQSKGELLESAQVFDRFYGTPKKFVMDQLAGGKTVLLAIDVQGAQQIRESLSGQIALLSLFILPPSVRVLRERLEGRKTESSEEVEKRIQTAQDEIKEAAFYDYSVINHKLEDTVVEVEKHIADFAKRLIERR